MSRIATALAHLSATPSAASVVTKGTLQSEFSASQERVSKLDALIEDMMFDEIDAAIARVLQLSTDLIVALKASSQDAADVQSGAAALGARASDLIRAGESIQNDPDDESATAQFVEISEQLPAQLSAHLSVVERRIDSVVVAVTPAPVVVAAAAPVTPTPVTPTPAPAPAVDHAAAEEAAKARNQKLLEERAAAASASAGSSASVAELKSTGLNSAEKLEEERLLRSMQRKGPSTPVRAAAAPAVAATPSPAASPAPATPAWKLKQEEDRRQAEIQLKKQQDEAREREARERAARAAKQPESPAVSSPMPSSASAKAEEERLERAMNRGSHHKPAPSTPTPAAAPKPVASPATTTPTASPAASGVPEWKRRQQERERELADKAKQEEEAKAKAAESVLAAAEVAQREREAARAAAPTTPTGGQTWEPKPRKQTLEQVATALGATEALKLGSPTAGSPSPSASAAAARFDDVRCAGCNVMIVGGYKNALGKCWHKECWKCAQCSKPLETKFANVGGKPMCVPCATERAKKAKAAQQ